jgi:hypothetical protein
MLAAASKLFPNRPKVIVNKLANSSEDVKKHLLAGEKMPFELWHFCRFPAPSHVWPKFVKKLSVQAPPIRTK